MPEHPDDIALDAFVEGLLDPAQRGALEAHLAQCGRCRAEVEAQRALLSGLRALPRTVDPEPTLLPDVRAGIRARAAADERAGWVRSLRAPLAAAAVFLVIVTAGVTALLLSERGARPDIASERAIRLASFEDSRADYVRTADDLALVLERHRDQLSPETVALVEANLRTIERALLEAEAALRADSASPVVRELILATHEQKVEVLRWANSLTRS